MKRNSGMSLIETIVTLCISSILVLILGYIIVSANTWWQNNSARVQLEDDMRFAKRRIDFLLRSATNTTGTSSGAAFSAVGSGVKKRGVYVGDGDYLQFNTNETIELVSGKLVHKKKGVQKEVLLNNVQRAVFHSMVVPDDPGDSVDTGCLAMLEFVTRKTLPNGMVIQSSSSIIVQNKNSGL